MSWSERAFCPCGWSDEPSFGNVWFTQQHHPCCPRCGGSKHAYQMHTVRHTRRQHGTWKLFWLFERPKWLFYFETTDGQEIHLCPIIDGRMMLISEAPHD